MTEQIDNEVREKILKNINAFRWEYTKAKIVSVTGLTPEAVNLMMDKYTDQILSLIQPLIEQAKQEVARSLLKRLRDYFVTTVELDGTYMHHIDEAEFTEKFESHYLKGEEK